QQSRKMLAALRSARGRIPAYREAPQPPPIPRRRACDKSRSVRAPISRRVLRLRARAALLPPAKSLLRMPGTGARKERGRQSRLRSVATLAKKIANRRQPAPSFPASWRLRRSRRRSWRRAASVIRCNGRSPRLRQSEAQDARLTFPGNRLIYKRILVSELIG